MGRKIQKQNWCTAARLLEFKLLIFIFNLLVTCHLCVQCTNISCYSKSKVYYINCNTSFSTSLVFVSHCSSFPSIPLQILTFLLSCIHSHFFGLIFCLLLSSLPAFFTQTHLPAFHLNTFRASIYLHAFIHSQKSSYQVFFILHIRQT